MIKIRSGIGYDIHRIGKGKALLVGGIKISKTQKAIAHSDGDVLIHALIDSLLGAMGEKQDIGDLFPDSDARYKKISSMILLKKVKKILDRNHFEILNIDCVLILEAPKITHFKHKIGKKIAKILDISPADFSIKAKTKEKLDSVGRGEAIECFCMSMVRYNK